MSQVGVYASCTKGTGSLQATKPRAARLEVNSTPCRRRLAGLIPGRLEEKIAAEMQRTLSCGSLAALVVKRGEERKQRSAGQDRCYRLMFAKEMTLVLHKHVIPLFTCQENSWPDLWELTWNIEDEDSCV